MHAAQSFHRRQIGEAFNVDLALGKAGDGESCRNRVFQLSPEQLGIGVEARIHVNMHIAEFQFRFNNREDQQIFAAVIIGLVIKSALRYKALTAKASPSQAPAASDEPF